MFRVFLLEPYLVSQSNFNRATPPPPPDLIHGEEEFEVEKILDKRRQYGRFEYLVKWIGHPTHLSTWEPAENLKHCEELLQGYESLPTNTRTRIRGRR